MDLTRRSHNLVTLAVLVAALTLACKADRPGRSVSPSDTASSEHAPRASQPSRSSQPEAQPEAQPVTDPERGRLAGITAAHNRVRAQLGVPPLVWSKELARYAQSWADKLQRKGCDLQHRPRSGPDTQRHGENLFGASGQTPDVNEVVGSWAEEVQNFNPKTNRCRGICGHYTQIVWRDSQRLGCAMATCGDTEVWVCNYDPPGNFVGERPY